MGNFTRFRMAGMIPARVAGRSDHHANKLVNVGVKRPRGLTVLERRRLGREIALLPLPGVDVPGDGAFCGDDARALKSGYDRVRDEVEIERDDAGVFREDPRGFGEVAVALAPVKRCEIAIDRAVEFQARPSTTVAS